MGHPDYFYPAGEYRTFEQGDFAALELLSTKKLHVYSTKDKTSITWRPKEYYYSIGVPQPHALRGKRICEIAPGLAEFALTCDGITIIDPIDYSQLSDFLQHVAVQSTSRVFQFQALILADRAHTYATSPSISHIQSGVVEAFDRDPSLHGVFDVVISTHLLEHFPDQETIREKILLYGHENTEFYIV